MENEIKDLVSYMKEQKEILENLNKEVKELNNNKNSIDDKESAFFKEAEANYNNKVEEYNRLVKFVNQQIKRRKDEIIEPLSEQMKTIDDINSDLKGKYAEIKSKREELEGAKGQLKWLESTLADDKNGEIKNLKDRIANLEESIALLSTEIKIRQDRLAKIVPEGKDSLDFYKQLQEKIKEIKGLNFKNINKFEEKMNNDNKKKKDENKKEDTNEKKTNEENTNEENTNEENTNEENTNEENTNEENTNEENTNEENTNEENENKEENKTNNDIEIQEVVGEGYIGSGFPSLEEQFEKITGKKMGETDEYDVVYDGATDDQGIEDDIYTPFKIVKVNKKEENENEQTEENNANEKDEDKPKRNPWSPPAMAGYEEMKKATDEEKRRDNDDGKDGATDGNGTADNVYDDFDQNDGQKSDGEEPKPGNDLPVKSGLQVYRKVLNEIGYIKGTKAITAHDWLNKFGLIGRVAAAGIRVATGRKKEMARIEDVLDQLSDEDLELMMDDYITKGNNTRTIISDKHNDIFLRALKTKLERYRDEKEPDLIEAETQLNDALEEKNEELKKDPTNEDIRHEIEVIGLAKAEITKKRVKLSDRIDTVERGRDEKSLDKKDNIVGKTRANRNPDNREEINELADIELKKLQAEKRGDMVASAQASYEMEEYRDSKTEYKYKMNGERKTSVGAFEAPMSEVKRISQRKYMAPEVIHALALVAGVSMAQAANMLNQQDAINQGIDRFNASNGQQISNLQGMASQGVVNKAQESLNTDALNIQVSGERASEFVGKFAENSTAYKGSDATMVGLSNDAINKVQVFTPKSNSAFGKLSEIFSKKAEIGNTIGKDVSKALGAGAKGYYNPANITTAAGVNHTATSALEKSAEALNTAQAETFGFMSQICDKISKLNPAQLSHIKLNLWPILATVIPSISRTTKDAIENQEKKVKKEEQVYEDDGQEIE